MYACCFLRCVTLIIASQRIAYILCLGMPIQIHELIQLVATELEHDEPTPYPEDDRQMLCLLFGAGA